MTRRHPRTEFRDLTIQQNYEIKYERSRVNRHTCTEDRKVVLEHFISSLQGKAAGEPIVIRKTLKLSTLSSEEEMKKQVSSTFNIHLEKLEKFNFLEGIENINANFKKVEALTTSYKEHLISLNSKADKFEELNDIGKFLISLNTPVSLIVPQKPLPYPDFIVANDDKKVGVEHTRLLNVDSQKFIKNIKQILKTAEKIVRDENPNLTQIINISFNYDIEVVNNKSLSNSTLTKAEKDLIAQLVASFVLSYIENSDTSIPGFIDKVSFSIDSVHPISINLIENYIGKTDIETLLIERLKSKEQKHSHYSRVDSIDELWLVIIVNGVTAASSFIIDSESLKNKIASNFNKIYLFDSFSNDAILIYSSTSGE